MSWEADLDRYKTACCDQYPYCNPCRYDENYDKEIREPDCMDLDFEDED